MTFGGRGGTGRHSGFKIRRSRELGGSIPSGRILTVIDGGRQEADTVRKLYPYETRKVRAELPFDGPEAA